MYLAGVSVRRVEDITEALWETKISHGTINNLNKKAYEHIETWLTCPLSGEHPYVYVDGVYLKRSWGRDPECFRSGCNRCQPVWLPWNPWCFWGYEKGFARASVLSLCCWKNASLLGYVWSSVIRILVCWRPFLKSFRMPDTSAVLYILQEHFFRYTTK